MLLNCGVGEDSWESLGLQGDPSNPSQRRPVLGVHWKDWCWRWNSSTLATWCDELIHLKRPWCWERLRAGGEGDDRGWDGWMASPNWWIWLWLNSRRWWWTGRPGVVWSKELDMTESLNWTELNCIDILALQGILKSVLHYHNSKASILRHSPFFMVQLSHPYVITGKTIALTMWTFVGKVMSQLLHMLLPYYTHQREEIY